MEWYSTDTGIKPEDGQEVLIHVNETYYISTYEKARDCFRANEETYFSTAQHEIYWTRFLRSPKHR